MTYRATAVAPAGLAIGRAAKTDAREDIAVGVVDVCEARPEKALQRRRAVLQIGDFANRGVYVLAHQACGGRKIVRPPRERISK